MPGLRWLTGCLGAIVVSGTAAATSAQTTIDPLPRPTGPQARRRQSRGGNDGQRGGANDNLNS
jgi:hypothetical protein